MFRGGRKPDVTGPAGDLVPITPSDTTDVDADALYIEGAGSLSVITEAGNTRTINVPDNFILPIAVRRVLVATTATGIHGFEAA